MVQYDVGFKVHMPGNTKESEYHIIVEAGDFAEGINVAQAAWLATTLPRNMTIKEVVKA
jgi:hypothetical protein